MKMQGSGASSSMKMQGSGASSSVENTGFRSEIERASGGLQN